MMRTSRRWVALAIFAFAVGACGGEDATPTTGDGTVAPSDSGPDAEESLADFTGAGVGSETDWPEQEARVQEAIRLCMAELGFEYLPLVPSEDAFVVWTEEGEEERIRTEGFGITTRFGKEDQSAGSEWTDPNEERLQAMTDAERRAWEDALHGTEEEQQQSIVERIDGETGEVTYDVGVRPGCYGTALEAEYATAAVNELMEELSPALDEMYERIQADPRMVEATREWASCMASHGFGQFGSRQDMYDAGWTDLEQRLEALTGGGSAGGPADPFPGWSEEEITAFFEESTQEEIDAHFAAAEREAAANADQDSLAALQQEEIDMAVADWECGESLNEVYTDVSADLERAFVDEHRPILEQIRDAKAGG